MNRRKKKKEQYSIKKVSRREKLGAIVHFSKHENVGWQNI